MGWRPAPGCGVTCGVTAWPGSPPYTLEVFFPARGGSKHPQPGAGELISTVTPKKSQHKRPATLIPTSPLFCWRAGWELCKFSLPFILPAVPQAPWRALGHCVEGHPCHQAGNWSTLVNVGGSAAREIGPLFLQSSLNLSNMCFGLLAFAAWARDSSTQGAAGSQGGRCLSEHPGCSQPYASGARSCTLPSAGLHHPLDGNSGQ